MPRQTAGEHFRELITPIGIFIVIPSFITAICLAILFAPTPEEKCRDVCRALQEEVKRSFSGVVAQVDTGRVISYRIKTAPHRHTNLVTTRPNAERIGLAIGDSIIKQGGSLVYTVHHSAQSFSVPYYVSVDVPSISSDCDCQLEINTTETERFFSSVRWFNDSINNVRP